jgi:hypothetical protein
MPKNELDIPPKVPGINCLLADNPRKLNQILNRLQFEVKKSMGSHELTKASFLFLELDKVFCIQDHLSINRP